MNKTPIEDTFRPTTVNEVLLLNRINELHKQRLLGRHNFDFGMNSLADYDFKIAKDQYTLHLAAEAYADEKWPDQIVITTKSHGRGENGMIGYQQFITKEMLRNLEGRMAAQMLGTLHEKLIRSLAQFLEDEKK